MSMSHEDEATRADDQRMATYDTWQRCRGCGDPTPDNELSTYGNCRVCVREIADMAQRHQREAGI